MEQRTVPVEALESNPWNVNRMSDRTFKAEKESISEFGFIDPVTVRQHPEIEDGFQIIDGEHRWKAAKDLGYEQVPIVVIEATDHEAQRLTVILNETRGESPDQELANALAQLAAEDEVAARRGLPYDNDEWQRYMNLAGLEQPPAEPPPELRAEGEWSTITASVPADFMQTWERAAEQAEQIYGNEGTALHEDPRVRAGQIIELITADFLAS